MYLKELNNVLSLVTTWFSRVVSLWLSVVLPVDLGSARQRSLSAVCGVVGFLTTLNESSVRDWETRDCLTPAARWVLATCTELTASKLRRQPEITAPSRADLRPNSVMLTSPWRPRQARDVAVDLSATSPTSPFPRRYGLVADLSREFY